MDHSEAVRLNATERYFLQELTPDQLEQFEEHLFDCPACAIDVRATAKLLDQCKELLAQTPGAVPVKLVPARKPWFAWLRPAFAVPVMAVLLAIIGYQTLVLLRGMRQAGVATLLPAASINVATRSAATPTIHARSGEPFLLLINLPAENRFSSYIADLYDPAGHIKWSVPISAETANDTVPIRIPGQREAGVYALAIRGIPQGGGNPSEVGRQPFELRLQ